MIKNRNWQTHRKVLSAEVSVWRFSFIYIRVSDHWYPLYLGQEMIYPSYLFGNLCEKRAKTNKSRSVVYNQANDWMFGGCMYL